MSKERSGVWIIFEFARHYSDGDIRTEHWYKCSSCGGVVKGIRYNYCPNCGAKIEKDCNGRKYDVKVVDEAKVEDISDIYPKTIFKEDEDGTIS